MAVEVLDYQGFSELRREGDVNEAVMMHLQSMQNLLTLLAKQQQQQQRPPAKQPDCTHLADAPILDFKKLITQLGGSGHARFRHAPATPVSQILSQGQHASNKGKFSSTSHDEVQTRQVSDIDVQCNSSCGSFNHVDVCMRNTNVHNASSASIDTQKVRAFQLSSSRSCSENEDKVPTCACSAMVNCASQMSCIASIDRFNSHKRRPSHLCGPCKEEDRDNTLSSLQVYGHARCRDSTAKKFCPNVSAASTRAFSQVHNNTLCQQAALAPSSFLALLSMEGGVGTVSHGKSVISSGRPPLPPKKRKFPEKMEDHTIQCHNSVNCHCAKRRKSKTRRIVRVSSMGLNSGDIPADGYSWCIYGEKLSKDSSQPRVYYKCSSVRGCPARKHVERASDDPNTLIVTYGREHLHPRIPKVLMASE